MIRDLIVRAKGGWAFILAASSAPLTYIMSGPCATTGCASCPLAGACLLSLPLILGGVVLVKFFRRTKLRLRSFRTKWRGAREDSSP